MICGAKIIAIAVTADRTTSTIVRNRLPTSHAASVPFVRAQSTSSGTKTLVRMPPSTSSYTMLGVVFAFA